MSMNDGGWDDAGFDGGGSGTGGDGGWGGPPTGAPINPRSAHAAPAWTTPKVIFPVAGVAVAAIVVLVVLLVTGGHSTPTAATPPPSTSSTPKPTPKTSPKKSPTTPKSTAPKLVSLADYDKSVDRICSDDVPKINKAVGRKNYTSAGNLLNTEFERLQSTETPSDDSDQARQWIDDLQKTLQTLDVKTITASILSRYNNDREATAALAKQLGMSSCQRALPKLP